ncbi:MAG: VWA domain-containing protein, partial [Bacteriovoracaceae bacterium]|nr:VWA domain-containing protein [Bacteriovoracaceae bacterium]
MSFVYSKFLIPLIVLVIFGVYISVRQEKKYFSWVKRYFFYRRSRISSMSSILFYIGFILLLFSILDLRGPEKKVSSDILDQKTLILIDTSSSMLAEDVRPNRYEKSLSLAKHFVKKAVGHQVGIALFSDTTIPSSPFTDDISYLSARLAALSELNLRRGGTSLVQSINEAVQILKVHSGGEKAVGNILVFTDSEDHGELSELTVPTTVSVALIGVGTVAGARIPIKSKSGEFLHYKKYRGQEVITKLDETKIKALGTSIENFKYWVALSYSIPTEEIVKFFRNQFVKTLSKAQITIRPVMAMWLLVPGLVLLGISFALSFPSTFICFLVLIATTVQSRNLMANEIKQEVKKIPPTELEVELMFKSKSGKATSSEKLKLAEELLKSSKLDLSLTLYEENLKESSADEAFANYGMALLKSGQKLKGAVVLSQLKQKLEAQESNPQLQEIIRKNIKHSFQMNKQKKKKDKEDK